MLATARAACLIGVQAHPVQVEVRLGEGLPGFDLVGLPERGVRESRIRVRAALSSIGFAFPAAMGAWAATQDKSAYRGRKVISVSGDGGFAQYMAEFTTAVRYGMNITHVLLNDGELGKISKEQRAGHWPVWQTGLRNPDFAAYAKSCGGLGIRVSAVGELEEALRRALAYTGPSLVEVMTDVELI